MTVRGRATARPGLVIAGVIGIAVALLAVYLVLWLRVTPTDIGRSDFTAQYGGGVLWGSVPHGDLYDPAAQNTVHARLIAPDHEGNLPFVNPPTLLVVLAPLASLPLHSAFWIEGGGGLVLVVVAAALASVAVAPRASLRVRLLACASVGLPSSLALLLLGQNDGYIAAGVGLACLLLARRRDVLGGAVLAVALALVKPHLGIGLAFFIVGWRQWRVLAGAAAGALAMAAIDFAMVGSSGIRGFITALSSDATAFHLSGMLGFTGITGSWLGDGALPQLLGAAASLAACVACVYLGDRVRRDRALLLPAISAAIVFSLLVAPHLLAHDLTILVVPAAIAATLVGTRISAAETAPETLRHLRDYIAALALTGVAELLDLGSDSPAPPGRLVPWVLLAIAAIATAKIRAVGRARRSSPDAEVG